MRTLMDKRRRRFSLSDQPTISESILYQTFCKHRKEMEELTVISQGGDVDETSQLQYDAAYNDPSANAIFTSSDGISFRVEEFYLKAVSPIFKDMFALPTKGGLVQLPETSDFIRVVLNQITGAEGEEVEAFDTMVSAFELAKRFDMKGPMASIKEELRGYWDGPKLLALACQQVPIDKPLVRTALSRFEDHMAMDSDIFRSHLDNRWKTEASPDPKNLTTNFLESLTVPGAMALVKAMGECEIESLSYWKRYDWPRVPIVFIDYLNHLGR